jgi:hypothetical protein
MINNNEFINFNEAEQNAWVDMVEKYSTIIKDLEKKVKEKNTIINNYQEYQLQQIKENELKQQRLEKIKYSAIGSITSGIIYMIIEFIRG